MVFNNIEQIASYYGLTPKAMREYHIVKTDTDVTIWQKGKASVHFLNDSRANDPKFKNVPRMSHDGSPKAAYQIALNVLKTPALQTEMGLSLEDIKNNHL